MGFAPIASRQTRTTSHATLATSISQRPARGRGDRGKHSLDRISFILNQQHRTHFWFLFQQQPPPKFRILDGDRASSFRSPGCSGWLTRPVEVIAFSDEEGIRFQTTFLGSATVAGILPESILQVSDKSGTTIQEALRLNSFEASADALGQVKYSPESYSESEVQKKSSMEVKIKKERYEV
ncbi:hypothetical protein ACQJBY_018875 [Aegilops geniculata]